MCSTCLGLRMSACLQEHHSVFLFYEKIRMLFGRYPNEQCMRPGVNAGIMRYVSGTWLCPRVDYSWIHESKA